MKTVLTPNEEQAIKWYQEGREPDCSTLIDEETLTYGYGYLHSVGVWEYDIPHRYLVKGEFKKVSELIKDFQKKNRA